MTRAKVRIAPFPFVVPGTRGYPHPTVLRPRLRFALAMAMAFACCLASCSSEDPSLERRGGPSPVGPVQDPPLPGAGGESGAGGAGAAETPIAFCDALVVMRDKCQRCHGDPLQNSAPVPFLTYADTQASYYDDPSRTWWQAMEMSIATNFMPFTGFNEPPTSLMPPVEPLTAEEKATLLGWLTQGAQPEGGTDCPAIP